MSKLVEHVHWSDAPDVWMPYAPAIKVKGAASIVYLAGVTAAPTYHHHPHRPEEFDRMPSDMESQTRAALENLKKSLEAVNACFGDISATRFVTDFRVRMLSTACGRNISAMPAGNDNGSSVQLATDPRCLVEINAIAAIG